MSELFLEDVLRLMVFVIRKTRRGRVSQKAGSASFNTTHWDQPLHKQSGRATTMLGILFFFPGTPLSYMSADAAKVCPRYFVFEEQQRHPNRSMIKRRVPNLTSGRVSDHDAEVSTLWTHVKEKQEQNWHEECDRTTEITPGETNFHFQIVDLKETWLLQNAQYNRKIYEYVNNNK